MCICTCTIYCLALTYQLHQIYYVRFLICIYNPANKYQYSLWYLILTPSGVTVTLKCNLCTRHCDTKVSSWHPYFYSVFIGLLLGSFKHVRVVLGNISIFWKYRDISFDNISYRRNFFNFWNMHCISILIVFIIF